MTAGFAIQTQDAPMIDGVGMVSVETSLMGGRVGIHQLGSGPHQDEHLEHDAARALGALGTWAARLTRFEPRSELSRLNDDPRTEVPVGPTLAAVLDWGRAAEVETDGIVNIAMLGQRISSETGGDAVPGAAAGWAATWPGTTPVLASNAWSLERTARGGVVRRPVGLRFDLDGVGKGWLADRTLRMLQRGDAAVVDADGDLALRLGPGSRWDVGVADTIDLDHTIATLRLESPSRFEGAEFGVATSGTSVHRWATHAGGEGEDPTRPNHHLIDPRTGRPAVTDVVQATVVARSARVAEAFAKTAVILGSSEALRLLDRTPIEGLLLLTEDRRVLATPRTLRYMA